MTFKHGKFDESVTMRSFERVAKEKGLITVDLFQKTASKKVDLKPSHNFMENILKLCAGLEQSGMAAYAEDLQKKFLIYKGATSLYETFNETGDDLVDRAHPDGSHKLEDVDGDGLVETILDQHLKMIKMVEKNPTGKLNSKSSSKDIINAVKFSLGGDETNTDKSTLTLNIKNIMERVSTTIQMAVSEANQSLRINYSLENFIPYIDKPTKQNLIILLQEIRKFYNRCKPGFFGSSISGISDEEDDLGESSWNRVSKLIANAEIYTKQALDIRLKLNEILIKERSEGIKQVSNEFKQENTANQSDKSNFNAKLIQIRNKAKEIADHENEQIKIYQTKPYKTQQGLDYANRFMNYNNGVVNSVDIVLKNMADPTQSAADAFNKSKFFAGIEFENQLDVKEKQIDAQKAKYDLWWNSK